MSPWESSAGRQRPNPTYLILPEYIYIYIYTYVCILHTYTHAVMIVISMIIMNTVVISHTVAAHPCKHAFTVPPRSFDVWKRLHRASLLVILLGPTVATLSCDACDSSSCKREDAAKSLDKGPPTHGPSLLRLENRLTFLCRQPPPDFCRLLHIGSRLGQVRGRMCSDIEQYIDRGQLAEKAKSLCGGKHSKACYMDQVKQNVCRVQAWRCRITIPPNIPGGISPKP